VVVMFIYKANNIAALLEIIKLDGVELYTIAANENHVFLEKALRYIKPLYRGPESSFPTALSKEDFKFAEELYQTLKKTDSQNGGVPPKKDSDTSRHSDQEV
jgi:hypothetical protein